MNEDGIVDPPPILGDSEARPAAHEHNRRAWNAMVRRRQRFTLPADDASFADPLRVVDGLGWLGPSIRGQRVLCLAAGGGRHSALYAAAGGIVTVVDLSESMLELDRQVAAERKLDVRTVHASMDRMPMLRDAEFDLVIHPVSTCYVADLRPVYREAARVTKAGGLYVSQHKQPTSLQADVVPTARGYELIVPLDHREPLPAARNSPHREEGTLEFLHRWDQLVGELCRSGFVIEDLIEPSHEDPAAGTGSFGHRSRFAAPYVRIKARRAGMPLRSPDWSVR